MPKYDSMRKIERNKQIVTLRQTRTDLSLKEIGDMFKISPERVWEILQNEAKREKLYGK